MTSSNGSSTNGKITLRQAVCPAPRRSPSVPESGQGTAFEHDRIPRRRDERGNRIAYGIAYIPPVSGTKDLDETQLQHLLDEVALADPVKAAYLRHLYADRLRPAAERLQSVRAEVERELADLRERSTALDAEIDPVVEDLAKKRDAALAPHLESLQAALADLDKAHAEAAERVALAGGSYDAEQPSEDSALRTPRISEPEAAARLRLPWGGEAKAFHLPVWVSWAVSCLCGTIIGISLGVFAGSIEGLFDDIPMLVTWVVLGQGIAITARKAIGWSSFHFSESLNLGRPRCQQVSWFVAMVSVFMSLLMAAMSVDKEGILKLAHFQSLLSGSEARPVPEFAMWCMAAVITLGYFIYAAYDGLVHGRVDAVANAVAAEIERDYRERSEARREMPTVKEALEGINRARGQMWKVARIEAAYREKQGEFDALIARQESRRVAFPEDLAEGQAYRVQDALDNLVGCQIEFDSVLAGVIGTSIRSSRTSEPKAKRAKPSFWARVNRALRAR